MKSYANFGLSRSFFQAIHAIRSRREAERNMGLLFQHLQQQERMMEQQFGRPLSGLEILEIGPGPGLERARYFSLRNKVVGFDLDVIPQGFDLRTYLGVLRQNGFGRLIKTIGRRMTIAGPNRRAWDRVVGQAGMQEPKILVGDICASTPTETGYDLVMSWSVFEHLPDPKAALTNILTALRPGGLLFISIHLYTANNGHHDIRAFSGRENTLPAWAHLRPAAFANVKPSAYLNQWRLDEWRQLFADLTPGFTEHLDTQNMKFHSLMSNQIREELAEYSDDELYTIDAVYVWKKPGSSEPAS